MEVAEDQISVWQRVKNGVGKSVSDLNNIFQAAFEGGGGVGGAIKSFATNALSSVLAVIPGIGPVLSQFSGAFVAAGQKMWGGIKKMFGGKGAGEKAAEDLVGAFESTITSSLSYFQKVEAQGDKWKSVVIGVRDAYISAGKSAADGEHAVQRLWDAVKEGPEATQAIINEIGEVTKAGKEAALALKTLTNETIAGLQNLVEEGKVAGGLLPTHLEPYLATLREAGLLTQEDEAHLNAMAEAAHTDWQAMKTSADKYNISLSELGPAFDSKRLHAAAAVITADWEVLNQEGVNTEAVMRGMSESVQDLITDAEEAGVGIPSSMEPIVTKMVGLGLITDSNGQKLTDLSTLNFAEPIADKFQQLIEKIGELIAKLTETGTKASNIKTTIGSIPNRAITVSVNYSDPGFSPNAGSIEAGDHSFQAGTHGRFLDFGQGTPAVLHGKERVTTLNEAQWEKTANANLLAEVSGLRSDIKNLLPLHLRDAILLSQ